MLDDQTLSNIFTNTALKVWNMPLLAERHPLWAPEVKGHRLYIVLGALYQCGR